MWHCGHSKLVISPFITTRRAFIANVNFGEHISLTLHCIETQWWSRLISNRTNKFRRTIRLFSMLSYADKRDLCRGDLLHMNVPVMRIRVLITNSSLCYFQAFLFSSISSSDLSYQLNNILVFCKNIEKSSSNRKKAMQSCGSHNELF